MAGDHGKSGGFLDGTQKKWLMWMGIVAISVLFVGPILFGAASGFICAASDEKLGYWCRMEDRFGKSAPPKVPQQDQPGYVPQAATVAPPVYAPPPARQYGGRQRYAAPPRVQPPRKRLINGPRERGPADEFCFRKFPHWRKIMTERDDCDMTVGHGSGGTDCHIKCGRR